MSTTSMTGADTVIINGRVLNDFADGDLAQITFPNEISQVKTGKNGNSIYALNETGRQCDVILRLIRASSDDKYMNELLSQQLNNFSGFILMIGQFVKKVGDGLGNITNDTYILSGGVFSKQVEVKSNAEGDTEQSASIWNMRFSNTPRVIG